MDEKNPTLGRSLDQRHLAFMERQNQCPLCGQQLEIRVESYLENYTLREEAHCSHCDVLARVKDHKMH